MRYYIVLILLTVGLCATDEGMLVGEWISVTPVSNQGSRTTEKEYLKLHADYTFDTDFLVTVEKGSAYVKNLHIEGKGIWKTRGDILVIVVNDVKVPAAEEVYGVSQKSLEAIATTFRRRFKEDPIRILLIKQLNHEILVTENKRKQRVEYNRRSLSSYRR